LSYKSNYYQMKEFLGMQPFFSGCHPLRLRIMKKLSLLTLICVFNTFALDGASFSNYFSSYPGSSLTAGYSDQQGLVTGTVKDAGTGETLVGVTVLVKGSTIGQLTDVNGKFSIRIPNREAILQFSFIGFSTQEIKVQQGSVVNVNLVEKTTQIDDVVVVGYGIQKKESVVGAITQVNNASLVRAGTSSITNAIAGKLSGVLTIQRNGEPGANDAEILIRGVSSWNGSQPLILVDGVERDFSSLDPNEINSIAVLKDASATSVFGAKGANGVMIVTTKRGSLGKAKINFSVNYGVERETTARDYVDGYTTAKMLNTGFMNAGGSYFSQLLPENVLQEYKSPSTPLNALRYPDVNWYKEVVNEYAPTSTSNLNVSGGTDFVRYFLNLGYDYEGSLFKGYKEGMVDSRWWNRRFNYRTNLDFTITKTTTISLNAGGSLNQKNTKGGGQFELLNQTSGIRFPAYWPSWVLDEVPDVDYPDDKDWRRSAVIGEYTNNTYTRMMQPAFNRNLSSKLFTDLILDQKLDFITKGLSVNGKVSFSTYYDATQISTAYNFPDYRLDWDLVPLAGQIDPSTGAKINPWVRTGQANEIYKLPPLSMSVGGLNGGYYKNLYYEVSFNYAGTFGKHRYTALALFNRTENRTESQFPFLNEAWVGRTTYDYNNKYLFEFNVGYTGSERFAPSKRFGLFPSLAIGWVVSEEKFFKSAVPWMNKLKMRYSDGLVGSDAASNRWLYNSSFIKDSNGDIIEDKIANQVAQWELAHKRDLGIEIGLFKNALSFSFDLYDEYRDKMLLTPNSSTMLIGNTFKELNLGAIKKHGIEIEVEHIRRVSDNFMYSVKGIFGFNENRIIFRDDPVYSPRQAAYAGKPLDAQMAGIELSGNGFYTSINDIHNNVALSAFSALHVGDFKFNDYSGDGIISTALDRHPINGSTYAPIAYSITPGIVWKDFEFSMMLAGNIGKYTSVGWGLQDPFPSGNWRVFTPNLNYWTPVNQNPKYQTITYGTQDPPGASLGQVAGLYWRRSDYLRLKDLYLGYTLKQTSQTKFFGLSSLTLYVMGANLFTISDLNIIDPEVTNQRTNYYPLMRSLKLGIKLNF
jgi:TonB-linked SusC/RagA family outer membrane protein